MNAKDDTNIFMLFEQNECLRLASKKKVEGGL